MWKGVKKDRAKFFLLKDFKPFHFRFVLYRCEKTILKKRNQHNKGCPSHSTLSYISVSIQTDPVQYNNLNHSNTIPRISNGSAKTGLTSLYSLSRNGSITAGYLLQPPHPRAQEHEHLMKRDTELDHYIKRDIEQEHLLKRDDIEIQSRSLVICHSPEDENDFTESDTGAQSEIGLCEKY
ncbi:uncharacterized protein LOC111713551 [Eurytemora carolleeae]|uniref:uncharacterized protein LOC111713551 n=1 Tax=Eurytemora carolleeae TaxID=1294199 RepID=UPI000C7684D4|nr:uncharacterized protein LOC111713551 [Eurytemora carolleeae]|eukprot:XP_023344201.1 uncharacterized protein LOC111713551 [Eurytemora affinis]